MFLKITAARGHQYLKLVESYREEGKVKQRQIANLGRLRTQYIAPLAAIGLNINDSIAFSPPFLS